jgi:glutathione S-transferase
LVLKDGRVIDESLDIMRHVLALNDPHIWLEGAGAQNLDLVSLIDDRFKDHLDHYKYPDRYDGDPLAHRAAGLRILNQLNDRLAETAFLAGPRCTMIDVAIFPFIRQFAAVDEAWFAAQNMAQLQNWLAGFLTGPMFAQVMVTLPVWKQGDAETHFP